ncbi:hypothetical protein [Brevibacillus sp. NRS-1366]|uniref:hypothetical protein n=1 Tax=Brevibacillus sp. NRS-1366 TaxID=3233899 RepID=UPI003D223195
MYLHIIWNDLLQDSESIEILQQQKSLFQTLDEHEIEEALVTINSDFIGEAYPHLFEITSTHESVEKLRKVIEKDGFSIIYSGWIRLQRTFNFYLFCHNTYGKHPRGISIYW